MTTKIITIIGTLMVWIPILTPILLSLIVLISKRVFLFDYLMPAELFPVALIGGGLLYWTAYRINYSKKLIGWSICIAVFSLLSGQIFATTTGAASGSINTFQWAFIIGTLLIYTFSILLLGSGGIRILKKIF